jgi:hypothetical protein
LERLEYVVITKASRHLAWKVFSDWRRWPEFCNIYSGIRWSKGEPWQPGSRMTIEISRPVKTSVDHVIVACIPGEHVAWIDHTMGNTMEQWVLFDRLPEGGTRVRTWAEFTGLTRVLDGRPIKALIAEFIRNWYENFRLACDELAERGVPEACGCIG